jgi:molybdate transport system substrate-binding protein
VKRAAIVVLVLLALGFTACGGDDGGSGSGGRLTVSAASSLKNAFTDYGQSFDAADVRLSFAGSDELAAQIRKGIRPDVFAAANTKLPDALYDEGLVEKPVVFAGNRLVIAVPAGSKIGSVEDLAKGGTKLAVGSKSVPVGDYTQTVLGRLDAGTREAILDNVRSEEPDVKGVVGKVSQGAVDAGFVYVTDVVATDGKLKAIELPAELQPSVNYGVAVVKHGNNPTAARKFVGGLVNGDGARILQDAGFEKPR